MKNGQKIRVVFICSGNICRSPMAEAVFQHLVEQEGLGERFEVTSAGTGDWHEGERPHIGTQEVLARKKVRLAPGKRAQQINGFILDADYLIAMDRSNQRDLRRMGVEAPLLLEFAGVNFPKDVPDPYYEGNFDEVYELVEEGTRGLLKEIRQREGV